MADTSIDLETLRKEVEALKNKNENDLVNFEFVRFNEQGDTILRSVFKDGTKGDEIIVKRGEKGFTGSVVIPPTEPEPPASNVPYGTIIEWTGNYVPENWMFTNGGLIPKRKYPHLSDILDNEEKKPEMNDYAIRIDSMEFDETNQRFIDIDKLVTLNSNYTNSTNSSYEKRYKDFIERNKNEILYAESDSRIPLCYLINYANLENIYLIKDWENENSENIQKLNVDFIFALADDYFNFNLKASQSSFFNEIINKDIFNGSNNYISENSNYYIPLDTSYNGANDYKGIILDKLYIFGFPSRDNNPNITYIDSYFKFIDNEIDFTLGAFSINSFNASGALSEKYANENNGIHKYSFIIEFGYIDKYGNNIIIERVKNVDIVENDPFNPKLKMYNFKKKFPKGTRLFTLKVKEDNFENTIIYKDEKTVKRKYNKMIYPYEIFYYSPSTNSFYSSNLYRNTSFTNLYSIVKLAWIGGFKFYFKNINKIPYINLRVPEEYDSSNRYKILYVGDFLNKEDVPETKETVIRGDLNG